MCQTEVQLIKAEQPVWVATYDGPQPIRPWHSNCWATFVDTLVADGAWRENIESFVKCRGLRPEDEPEPEEEEPKTKGPEPDQGPEPDPEPEPKTKRQRQSRIVWPPATAALTLI